MTFISTPSVAMKWLKWPGRSVLTVMTMVVVLPAMDKTATIGKTLIPALIALLYFIVIIDLKMAKIVV